MQWIYRLLFSFSFLLVPLFAWSMDCPSSHPLFSSQCNQCFASAAQAASANCAVNSNPGSGSSSSGGSSSNNCPSSHPIFSSSCDRCFATENQANSSGCSVGGGNGGTPTPTLSPTPAPTPTPTSPPNNPTPNPTTPPGNGNPVSGSLRPPNGQGIMIIGQDLASSAGYVNSGRFPTPGGITTYVAFYDILNDNAGNGALGINSSGQINTNDVDWGAGPLHAYNAAVGFPNSTLQIGLNIAEGSNATGNFWCAGCLAQLANGSFTAEINQLANFFNRISSTPVYLRIGYEFDGQWNAGYENTQNYISAYRNIVRGLRNAGVSNVAFVWQSSTSPIDDILEGRRENINDWYPGDNFVDWLGMSWFLGPNETAPVGGTVSTQIQLANEVVNMARSRGKPVMIAEATAQGYDLSASTNSNISTVWDGTSGGNTRSLSGQALWNEWFAPFFNYISDNSDVIQAVSYINANWDSQGLWGPPYTEGYWGDTRIEANGTISNNWNQELNRSYWLHGGNSLFNTLSD